MQELKIFQIEMIDSEIPVIVNPKVVIGVGDEVIFIWLRIKLIPKHITAKCYAQ